MATLKLMPTQVRVSITNRADGLYQLFVLGEGAPSPGGLAASPV